MTYHPIRMERVRDGGAIGKCPDRGVAIGTLLARAYGTIGNWPEGVKGECRDRGSIEICSGPSYPGGAATGASRSCRAVRIRYGRNRPAPGIYSGRGRGAVAAPCRPDCGSIGSYLRRSGGAVRTNLGLDAFGGARFDHGTGSVRVVGDIGTFLNFGPLGANRNHGHIHICNLQVEERKDIKFITRKP